MKTTIKISDNYKVEIDDWYNHTLYEWKKSELITAGKFKDTMSKAGWREVGHFPNIQIALRNAAQIEVLKGNDTYTLTEYAQIFEKMWNDMKDAVVEVKNAK